MNSRTEYRYDDKTGVYIGEQTNTLTYRDKDFYPLPWCVLDKPEPPAVKIAVINSDKTAWEYKDDVSGVWYDTATGAEVRLTAADYERDTSAMTRSKPGELQKWDGSAWVDDERAKAAVKLAALDAEIAALEAKTYRPLRELALDAKSADAAAILKTLDDKIAALRAQRGKLSAK